MEQYGFWGDYVIFLVTFIGQGKLAQILHIIFIICVNEKNEKVMLTIN